MFNSKLESLRGIAALAVAISHSLIVFSVDQNETIWLTRFYETSGIQSFITSLLLVLFNGGAAVTIFFVLSGYVLGLSLDKRPLKTAGVFSFYVRRIFRIYPAYLVSLLTIISSIYFFHTYIKFPNSSVWFNWWYMGELSLSNAANNLAMLETNLNPVAWTLRVELVMSFLFPFAYLINRKIGVKANLLVLTLMIIVSAFYSGNIYLRFGFVFYLGLLLPIIVEKLHSTATKTKYNILLAVSIFMLLYSRRIFVNHDVFYAILVEGICSFLIIATVTDSKINNFLSCILDLEIVRKLGQVSYSFYVYHFIILYWLAYCLFKFIPPEVTRIYPLPLGIILAVVSVPLCFQVAKLSYQYVEQPMIKQGAVTAEYFLRRIRIFSVPYNISLRLNRLKSYFQKTWLAFGLLIKKKYR